MSSIVFICALASADYPIGLADYVTPDLGGAALAVSVTQTADGLYHYSYSVTNSLASTGAISGVEIQLPTSPGPPVSHSSMPRDHWCTESYGDATVVVPVGGGTQLPWSLCLSRDGRFVAWAIWDTDVVLPGQSLTDAFQIVSTAPPGQTSISIVPAWDPPLLMPDPNLPSSDVPFRRIATVLAPFVPGSGPPSAFASFVISGHRFSHSGNGYTLLIDYVLGTASNGISPPLESVTVAFDDVEPGHGHPISSETIPPGSFQPLNNDSGWKYTGRGGIDSMTITRNGHMKIVARKVSGPGWRPYLQLTVRIGEDFGVSLVPPP